jgi:hypothetical protein
MLLARRKFLALTAGAVAVPALPRIARAQSLSDAADPKIKRRGLLTSAAHRLRVHRQTLPN